MFRLGVCVWYIEKATPPRQLWAVEDQLFGFAQVFDRCGGSLGQPQDCRRKADSGSVEPKSGGEFGNCRLPIRYLPGGVAGIGRLLIPLALDGKQAHSQAGGSQALGPGRSRDPGRPPFFEMRAKSFLVRHLDAVTHEGCHGSQNSGLQLAGAAGQALAIEDEAATWSECVLPSHLRWSICSAHRVLRTASSGSNVLTGGPEPFFGSN